MVSISTGPRFVAASAVAGLVGTWDGEGWDSDLEVTFGARVRGCTAFFGVRVDSMFFIVFTFISDALAVSGGGTEAVEIAPEGFF